MHISIGVFVEVEIHKRRKHKAIDRSKGGLIETLLVLG